MDTKILTVRPAPTLVRPRIIFNFAPQNAYPKYQPSRSEIANMIGAAGSGNLVRCDDSVFIGDISICAHETGPIAEFVGPRGICKYCGVRIADFVCADQDDRLVANDFGKFAVL